MLNCCIARKKAREERQSKQAAARNFSTTSLLSDEGETIDNDASMESTDENRFPKRSESDSEEEFFECVDEEEKDKDTEKKVRTLEEAEENLEEDKERQPEGRLKVCDDLKLLNSDEDMYIPITQVMCSMNIMLL